VLLERVHGHALMYVGDYAGARLALEASLAAARARKDLQETMLALHSLLELHRRAGETPLPAMVGEFESLVARLKIHELPRIPAPARL
jgi:hypothetical protein